MRRVAGTLRERLGLLALCPDGAGGFHWVRQREICGGVERTGKSCLFSKVGIGAEGISVLLRHCDEITLHNALLFRGKHLFLYARNEPDRAWLEVSAAEVASITCRARVITAGLGAGNRPTYSETGFSFPGVLTEKYMGYERGEAHGQNESVLVLVTPKPVLISAGDMVVLPPGSVAPGTYAVALCHCLDPYKNEYELRQQKDV